MGKVVFPVTTVKDFILSFGALGSDLLLAASRVRNENVTSRQIVRCNVLERLRDKIKFPVVSSLKVERMLKAAVFDYAVGRKELYDEIDEFPSEKEK